MGHRDVSLPVEDEVTVLRGRVLRGDPHCGRDATTALVADYCLGRYRRDWLRGEAFRPQPPPRSTRDVQEEREVRHLAIMKHVGEHIALFDIRYGSAATHEHQTMEVLELVRPRAK